MVEIFIIFINGSLFIKGNIIIFGWSQKLDKYSLKEIKTFEGIH
jgi:hypothetical protein